MAKKSLTFDDLSVAFQHGNFEPLYFLYGDEGLLIDELQQLLLKNALQPHERDFNLDLFFGPEASLMSATSTWTCFSGQRQMRVRCSQRAPASR